jgi:citrate synthase
VAVLDAALVLLADHELATSTLAARVAASTRADPFAVVLAGLGAVSGPLHGKAALGAHQLVEDARRAPAVGAVVARTLAGGRLPGFGHPVYRGVDPRARHLLDRLADLLPRSERAVIDDVLAAASGLSDQPANVDFALGALASGLHMPLGATEAIFAVARIAGWIAHALEEYGEEPLRFRARAIYVGPPPR